MAELKDVKQRFIDYLMSMDFDKMDMNAIQSYACIVKVLGDMDNQSYLSDLAKSFASKNTEEVKENG